VIAFFSFSIRMNAWLWDWFLELQENALRMAIDTKSSRLMEIKKDFEISHAITCQKQRTAACETGITTSEKATTSEKQFPRHSEKKNLLPSHPTRNGVCSQNEVQVVCFVPYRNGEGPNE
jgi:hypothetical protein